MLNPIDEMRKLSLKSYDELLRIATSNCGFCPNGSRYSKVELITYIVSQMAIRAYFNDHLNLGAAAVDNEHERKEYVLEDDDHTCHVKLTKEQIDFMYWCLDHEINFYNLDIREAIDIDWEEP